jgi:hypothetical protein
LGRAILLPVSGLGQRDSERAAMADIALNLNRPGHQLDQTATQG